MTRHARDHDVAIGAPDAGIAISAYAQGLFAMDDPGDQARTLPFYRADPRAIFELDGLSLGYLRHVVRRSLARDPGWEPALDRDFEGVLAGCAAPRPGQGVWLTERMEQLYRNLHAAGAAHSFELWADGELAAGVLGVVLNGAAMLETMFHCVPDSGNVNVVRTLERLVDAGVVLCDLQLITAHTRRLGAREIPADEYQRRLAIALATPSAI